MFKQFPFLAIFVFSSLASFCQEVIYPLSTNEALTHSAANAQLRLAAIDDTLTLPFRDDFSRPGMYPFDGLWLDSNAYINNNYSELPFTIGIATLDGLNQYGRPYAPASSVDGLADFLTSRPVDLGVIPSADTSVWFSFFYQPEGLGDIPEEGDSLVLQFKDSGGVWNEVWSVDGRGDTAFQRVNIRVTGANYLFKGFQFRFYNVATINGNRDHWNLDYVFLDKGRTDNDGIQDFSMLRPIGSLLTEFTAMPYTHYKSLGSPPPAGTMIDSLRDTIYVINYGPTSLTPSIDIYQVGQTVPDYHVSTFLPSVNPLTYAPYSMPLTYYYPSLSTDSADFLVKSYVNQAATALNQDNDTSYYYQHFHNYYSYDDGSVEVSYGVTGDQDISMAYQFNIKMADTLRAVDIYFNPTGENVTNKLFQLTVWSDVNVGLNQSTELYRMINQKPDSFLSINGFRTYVFDQTLVVGPGNIWVGIIQNEPQTKYGVGLDRNTDSHDKMFVHINGHWAQSNIPGSWMIRPVFGKKLTIGIDELNAGISSFTIWPNPATYTVHLQPDEQKQKNYSYQIYNCLGSLTMENTLNASYEINISGLSQGMYMIRLIDKEGNKSSMRKLIVQ